MENEPVLPFPTVGAHLADMADAALTAALHVATVTVCKGDTSAPRLAVIAMGKCGARELNYVSDVDVIFVGDTADATETRVAGEMMRLASETFFEVDAALRPEGKRGQLVRTLDSHIAYYERWAKTWEFQALLKARPAVGDAELGEQYMAALMPMVWTASEREDFVVDVQAMRRRVVELVPADVRSREIKLGTGGLRDVEFAVQLLQLVHGRNNDSLHVTSTVEALAALGSGGYVGRDDAANMTASYEFLRLLEHRLQLQRLKRTHMLPAPDDDEALRWLARAAHVRPDGQHDALGVLREELKRQSVRVSRLHAKLFYQPLLESVVGAVDLRSGMTSEAAERQLAALGYQAPRSALTHLAALTTQGGRRARVQTVLLPTLLDWLSDTPDPDAGLLAYRRISESLADARWYLSSLRDEGAVAKRLMHVLGTSAYVPDLLMRAPEVIQQYADGPTGPKLLDVEPDVVARSLVAAAGRYSDPVKAIAAARTLRRRELARIASADLLGMLDVRSVCKALTSIWVAVLQAALEAVIRVNTPADGTIPAKFSVIGMGRLGGGELGYGSDADVMLVYRRAGARPAEHPQCGPAAGGGRQPPARRTQRSAGAHPGLLRRLLRTVGPVVGSPGVAAGPPGGGRSRTRPPLPADGRQDPLPGGGRVRGRGAGDPADQGPRRCRAAAAWGRSQHPHQAGPRGTGRRRMDRAAAAAAVRTQNSSAAQHLDAGVAGCHRRCRADRRR
ncbi:MAG: bifunctional glutamine-synthetase adenylyltransferase/deadenyltransferase [Mycobacterium sp.]|nr:bifunctional glutamine-synthetase adenylyltransferase/deadenyltransferase [Mycobacterium sp.]